MPTAPDSAASEFYAGWARGQAALAKAARGDAFASRGEADAYCSKALGKGWRMAEFHDGGGGWGLIANGPIKG